MTKRTGEALKTWRRGNVDRLRRLAPPWRFYVETDGRWWEVEVVSWYANRRYLRFAVRTGWDCRTRVARVRRPGW